MEGDDLLGSDRLLATITSEKDETSVLNREIKVGSKDERLSNHEHDDDGAAIEEEQNNSEGSLVVVDEVGPETDEGEDEGEKETEIHNKERDKVLQDVPGNMMDVESSLSSNATTQVESNKEDNESCKCSCCPHLEELSRLKQENKLLLQQVQELQSQCCVTTLHSSEVEIKFLNKSLEKKYRQDVENFLWKLLEKSASKSTHLNKDECNLEASTNFYIDKKSLKEATSKNEACKVPSYSSNFTETLDAETKGTSEVIKKTKSIKTTCFNCLGNHMLQECPVEKNRHKIAQNRQEFLSKSGGGAGKQNRYHADNDLMFSSFKPGILSKNLRHALGIHHKDLPYYIYRMRNLGYPPGWLKEAEISSSGLTMYDSEGKEIVGETVEDGEVGVPTDIRVQYDPSRLVDYPGFNVYAERGTKDKCRKYGYPPIQEFQLKRNVMLCMKAPEAQPYKRKALADFSNAKRQKVSHEVADMDIDEASEDSHTGKDDSDVGSFLSPLPRSQRDSVHLTPTTPCSREPSDSESEISLKKSRTLYPPSPSLEDLELARKRLMGQLKSVGASSFLDDSTGGSQTPLNSPKHSALSRLRVTSSGSQDSGDEGNATPKQNTTVAQNTFSASKSMQLGSPSIIQTSKGLKLPGPEKFAVGISEHIPFENLPDSTGQYKRMKGVLNKIRAIDSDMIR